VRGVIDEMDDSLVDDMMREVEIGKMSDMLIRL
jgi:hypothetical protein